jgi:hypothetical protein
MIKPQPTVRFYQRRAEPPRGDLTSSPGGRHHRHGRLAVILQEGQPALTGVAAAADTLQISCYAPFGDDEAELLKFSVDFLGTPVWVFVCHAADEGSNLNWGEDVSV